ncbi:MAG: hypothetical protein E7480_03240 [Ruminococcaceae bacterium]|nr:hypothetical protein [Oscillospiraceae bacterium]
MELFLKRKLLYVLCALVILIMSGCNSVDDLSGFLVPPQTTEKMKELKSDIYKLVGSEITFLQPAKGNFRNTINFMDIDSDEEQEAIAVYAPQSGDSVAHILVLKNSIGHWAQLIRFSITGIGVDIIEFIDYNGDGRKEIVIGVSTKFGDSKGLSVYDISGSSEKELLTHQYNYINITPQNEILTISLNKEKSNKASLIVADNSLPTVVSECNLFSQATAITNIYFGKTEASPAFFISETLDNVNNLTEIISLDNKTIKNLTLNNDITLFDSLLKRAGYPYIQDIDNDGVTEISKAIQPNETIQQGNENMRIIEWFSFSGNSFNHNMYSIINPNEKYFLVFPEKWLGKVNAIKETGNQITFYIQNENKEKINLFSIYSLSPEDWEKKENKVNWSVLKRNEERLFALYIYDPLSQYSSMLSITPAYIENNFFQATFIQK